MTQSPIAVLGAGIAGLAAALLLARDGHDVLLVDRDDFESGSADESSTWQRRGVPHFHQPHAFIPRGRAELIAALPDVYADLLAAGACDVDVRKKLRGPVVDGDEQLQFLAVRRPLIEWALRRAVTHESRIDVRDGSPVDGLRVESGRVVGLRCGDAMVPTGLVVDALGRRTPTAMWLGDAGVPAGPRESSDCFVTYFSRYYRVLPGRELPDGPWLLGPRGDLGYLGFSTFPGDNNTFAVNFAVPSGDQRWRVLNSAAAFEAAVAAIPGLRQWVDPDLASPLTGVAPMAGLRNTLRSYAADDASSGLVPIGDAYSHTDPVLAHGLSFALVHAAALAQSLRENTDATDALAAYATQTSPALRQRYDLATAVDDQRRRMWAGEQVDFRHADGDYELFTLVAGGAAALVDPDVFRVMVRRLGLLDGTEVLDSDALMQQRIETIFAEMTATPRPRPGPDPDELFALASAAAE